MAEKDITEENMAVDLLMFEEAVNAAHYDKVSYLKYFYEEYEKLMGDKVIRNVEAIKGRRRYV